MADKPKVKPSSAGVWIGLVMMLLSFASCGAGCVLAGSEIKDAADAAQRVDVPASQTYDMEADAAGIIIGLAPSASDAKDIEVSLTDENGTAVEVSTSSSFSSSTTESKGDSVEVLGTFEAHRGVDGLVAADVEVADELVEEQPAQALRAAAVAGEQGAFHHLGQVHEREHGPVEVGEVPPKDRLLGTAEVFGDVGGHGVRG